MTRSDRSRGWTGWVRVCAAAGVLALVLLAQPREAAALKSCAAYVSGGANYPSSGFLIGTMTVEECAMVQGGIPGTGASYQRCVEYEVGYYNFGEGAPTQLDCRDYGVWDSQ